MPRRIVPLFIAMLLLVVGCQSTETGGKPLVDGNLPNNLVLDQAEAAENGADHGTMKINTAGGQEPDEEDLNMRTIYLAGGCFWGVQKFFDQFDGVVSTEVGYANGPEEQPTYREVCNSSGHAETVKVDYDPAKISLTELLEYYFMIIDPLSINKQGNDRGIQYRTGIYYTDDSQLAEVDAVYEAQQEKAGAKLAVEKEPLRNFYSAEEYHQKYLEKNPGGYCHIPSKMFRLNQ